MEEVVFRCDIGIWDQRYQIDPIIPSDCHPIQEFQEVVDDGMHIFQESQTTSTSNITSISLLRDSYFGIEHIVHRSRTAAFRAPHKLLNFTSHPLQRIAAPTLIVESIVECLRLR